MRKVKAFTLALVLGMLVPFLATATAIHAGVPIGSRFVIRNDASATEVEPAIAYNSQRGEYLVVWHNEWAANKDIYGQRVAGDGTLVGPWFAISPAGGDRYNPDVAYDSQHDQYLMVWEDGLDVRGRLISATGGFLTGEFLIAEGYVGLDSATNPHVAYASHADQYLVIWQYGGSVGSSIQAQAYDWNGAPNGSTFDVVPYTQYASAAPPEQPDLAYNRSRNEHLVVWQQKPSGGNYDVYGRRVKMTGGADVLGSAFPIATSVDDEVTPAVAAIPTEPNHGQYLVAWERKTGFTRDIQARPVAGDGSLTFIVTLADSPWSEHSPALAGCEGQHRFLATWVWIPVVTPPAMMQVQARTLALDGTLLDETTNVSGGQVFQAAVSAASGCGFLVAFDDNEVIGISNRGIYGRVWGSRVYLPLIVRNFP
jgi:hypothetical protein